MSKFFINRPIVAIVISIVLVLVGHDRRLEQLPLSGHSHHRRGDGV